MDFISTLALVLDSNRTLGLQPERWSTKGLILVPTPDNTFLEFFGGDFKKQPISIETFLYFEAWQTVTLYSFNDDDTLPGGPE